MPIKKLSKKTRVLIYVVYHDDKSYQSCYELLHECEWAKFIKIPTTKYCESILFDYLLENQREWMIGYEFVGMITYSFNNKVELSTLEDVVSKINQNQCLDLDIIGLRGLKFTIGDVSQTGIEEPLKAVMQHFTTSDFDHSFNQPRNPSIPMLVELPNYSLGSISIRDIKNKMRVRNESSSKALREILQGSTTLEAEEPRNVPVHGIDITEHIDSITPFFSNYWLMRPLKLLNFLKWAKQVKTLMEENLSLNEKLMKDSGYKVQSQSFEPIFNHPWMTWHPFVMERMICIYTYFSKLRLHVYKSNIKPKNNKRKFG